MWYFSRTYQGCIIFKIQGGGANFDDLRGGREWKIGHQKAFFFILLILFSQIVLFSSNNHFLSPIQQIKLNFVFAHRANDDFREIYTLIILGSALSNYWRLCHERKPSPVRMVNITFFRRKYFSLHKCCFFKLLGAGKSLFLKYKP